jgi:hypothetical protein
MLAARHPRTLPIRDIPERIRYSQKRQPDVRNGVDAQGPPILLGPVTAQNAFVVRDRLPIALHAENH